MATTLELVGFAENSWYDPREESCKLELVIDNATAKIPKSVHAIDSLEALGIKMVGHTYLYVRERAEYEANGREITRKGQSRFTSNKDVGDIVTEHETLFRTNEDSLQQQVRRFDFAVEYLSSTQIQAAQEKLYQAALKLVERGKYTTALSIGDKLTRKQQSLLIEASRAYLQQEMIDETAELTMYETALEAVNRGDYTTALSSKERMREKRQKEVGAAIVNHFLRTTPTTFQNEAAKTALQEWYDWKAFESKADFFQAAGNEKVYDVGMNQNSKARSSLLMLEMARWAAQKDLSAVHISEALAEYTVLQSVERRIEQLLEAQTQETAREAHSLAVEYNLHSMREEADEQLRVHAQFGQERAALTCYQDAARFNLRWLEDGRVAFAPAEIRKPFGLIHSLVHCFRRPRMAEA